MPLDPNVTVGLIELAKKGIEFFTALQKVSQEDLKNAIEKAKSTGGDTSDLERVLNGGT